MKLASMIALALLTGLMLVSCGGSTAGDDAGDTLQGDMVCAPQCDGKECGMDGCGGICGGCNGTDVCDAGGHCVAPCVATCTGKECGDDGCGSTCGACDQGETCTAAGLCLGGCVPACGGKQCGPDGCNGTCGACDQGETCTAAGLCQGGCEPACGGKQCGPDGCNGSCGACDQGETCTAAGLCQGGCVPSCLHKACGDDGCGASCGTCGNGQTCSAVGQCEGTCLPDCTGKVCGPDGCGGACGTCAVGEACTAAGLCQGGCTADCAGKVCGSDGCGGACGTCGTGTCTAAGQCATDDPCQGVSYEGCCAGDTVRWCEDGELNEVPCADAYDAGAAEGPSCGWSADGGYYWCMTDATADPSGAFPRTCGACTADCTGKVCGSDGCGGSCGTCAQGETCAAGQCTTGGGDWICDPTYYADGEFCDCACGQVDPDCDVPGAEVFGCADGETCDATGQCATGSGDWTCDPTYYNDGEYCDCECGQGDPDCDATTVDVFGCDAGQTCDAAGHCTGDIVDTCGGVTWEGCCTGAVLTYCEAGEIVTLPCSDVGVDAVCGWYDGDDTYDPSYNCGPASVLDVTGDPSGTFPMACAGTCTPACAGKQCGDDGCGGSCGACTGDDGCDAAGQCVNHCGGVSYEGCCVGAKLVYCLDGELTEMICNAPDATDDVCGWYPGTTDYPFGYYCGPETDVNGDPLIDPAGDPSGTWPLTCPGACVPACAGKQCGDDGCGGSCGTCPAGETCTAGQCQGVCQPACTDKACGDDGCGGSCGSCEGGDTCVAGTCVAPCDRAGFTVEGDAAAYDPDAQLLVYAAVQPSNPADYLSLELWQRFGGPTSPGSYLLTAENYETCATCVLIDTDCTATTCQKTFLATAGGVTLAELGVIGDTFAGTLTNVTLVEVTIDPDTYVSTPVPGGETWCLDTLTFDVPIDAWPSN